MELNNSTAAHSATTHSTVESPAPAEAARHPILHWLLTLIEARSNAIGAWGQTPRQRR